MRRRWLWAVAALTAALVVVAAVHDPSANVLLDAAYDSPADLSDGRELVVKGVNRAATPVTLIVRIDDGRSRDYASRINIERIVPPGPFTVRMAIDGLRTPAGRVFDTADIRRLIVFVPEDQTPPTVERIGLEKLPLLPGNSRGWDFGPADGPVFAGFEAVAPGDPRVTGPAVRAVRRPAGDALIVDGLKGMRRFETALPNGEWTVTLWTADLGEWEYLPHPLERRIKVNGHTVLARRLAPEAWIEQVYLAGRGPEAIADGDPWEVFGARRGGRVEIAVTVRDGRLVVELAGDSPPALYLAGLLAAPIGDPRAARQVRALRARQFRETWLVERHGRPRRKPGPTGLALWRVPFGAPITPDMSPSEVSFPPTLVAPGTGTTLEFLALSDRDRRCAAAANIEPMGGGAPLTATLRAGHWRYDRPSPGATFLVASAAHLRGDGAFLGVREGLPRRYTLRVEIPEHAEAARYRGAMTVECDGAARRVDFTLEVIGTRPPRPDRPIGVYLERAPHFQWFADLAGHAAAGTACDLAFLRRLGLTGLAPPLTTPDAGGLAEFLDDLGQVRRAGFDQAMLSYSAVKRLLRTLTPEQVGARLAEARRAADARGLEPPIWSIADEPSNPGASSGDLGALAGAIREAAPGVLLAGHLNTPGDEKYLPFLDVALVNAGFGVDRSDLETVRRAGVTPWLYNMESPRLAAGFYLWRVGAGGFLQWHGRMPTADPFDPTDGREADVQLLYPTAGPCPERHDVHADLLALAEGVTDLRWMLWLDGAAETSADAARLRESLRQAIPDTWDGALAEGPLAPRRWRAPIMTLAQNLRPHGSPGPRIAK